MPFLVATLFTHDSNSIATAPGVISKIIQCGRVLGLRYHSDGYLYVVESTNGLYRVNITSNTKEHLSLGTKSDQPVIYNDLVFDPVQDNLLYVSVSSSRWYLDQIAWSIVEHDASGYILAVDLKNEKSIKITEGHSMLNGIEITTDKKNLLFAGIFYKIFCCAF